VTNSAIALFLAIAERSTKLRFLVLDDVINSFDREHRGKLPTCWPASSPVAAGGARARPPVLEHLTRRAPSWRKLESRRGAAKAHRRLRDQRHPAAARERIEQETGGAAAKARRAGGQLRESPGAEAPLASGAASQRAARDRRLPRRAPRVEEHAGQLDELGRFARGGGRRPR
jgi:hypothetical protein